MDLARGSPVASLEPDHADAELALDVAGLLQTGADTGEVVAGVAAEAEVIGAASRRAVVAVGGTSREAGVRAGRAGRLRHEEHPGVA